MARRRKPKGLAIDGILLLNKPAGISSNQALQQVKRLFQAQKAGHTGSLDPLATGMLPICFGEATKFSSFLLDADKSYSTTATLGVTTTTGDAEGEIIHQQAPPPLTRSLIETILESFRGSIEQIPPMYSALKHQGKPLYELARQGIEVKRKSRTVHIHRLELQHYTDTTLELQVDCSKGTYIRTLVEDIGQALGCGAHVTRLHRSTVSPFSQYPMHSLEKLQQLPPADLNTLLLPVDAGLQTLPPVTLNKAQCQELFFGRPVPLEALDDPGKKQEQTGFVRIHDVQKNFLGIGIIDPQSRLQPKRLVQQPVITINNSGEHKFLRTRHRDES